MSGLQDKIDNIEETLKSYEAEIPVIVEKGIDIDNILINEQFIDEKYNESLKNELLNNIKSCISDQLKTLVRTQISELRSELMNVLLAERFNNDENFMFQDPNYGLIRHMEKEIEFLRSQAKEKDIIIREITTKSLLHINEKNIHCKCINDNTFKQQIPEEIKNSDTITKDNDIENSINIEAIIEDSTAFKNVTKRKDNKSNENKILHNNNIAKPTSSSNNTDVNNIKENNPIVYIIGDSIIKDLKGWKMSQQTNNTSKIIVKSFPGATTDDMQAYIQPSVKQSPNEAIIHIGTNDLKSTKQPKLISKKIIDIANKFDMEKTTVKISALTPRGDQFSKKVAQVNECLKKDCGERNLCFIEHVNINSSIHLNRSNVHLNKNGTKAICRNFLKFIKKK